MVLPGVLHQDDVAASLAAADIVVVPSVRDRSGNVDGLPNVVLEALASATPVVATPAGGIGSVVRDGVTGLLVPEARRGGAGLGDCGAARCPGAACGAGHDCAAVGRDEGSWGRAIDRFEDAYEIACRPPNGRA